MENESIEFVSKCKGLKCFDTYECFYLESYLKGFPLTLRETNICFPEEYEIKDPAEIKKILRYLIKVDVEIPVGQAQILNLRHFYLEIKETEEIFTLKSKRIEVTANNIFQVMSHTDCLKTQKKYKFTLLSSILIRPFWQEEAYFLR